MMMTIILVVDDDPIVRDMVALLLEDDGYQTIAACNGQEALDYLHQQRPQLVMSDLLMPIIDGWTLHRAMQANSSYASIPFVVMSSVYTPDFIQQRMMPAAVLRKPINAQRLLSTIRALLPP
ncbi:MAG: response regulator [Chloroflexaceae bacterium]|nr:response regulator [Chloroflexaceae bacterium]